MPQIAGLRGVLYDPTKVQLAKVVSPPSDAVSDPATRAALAAQDPHNIIRLAHGGEGATLAAWLAAGVLARDPGRAVYRYHQLFQHPDLGDRRVTRKLLIAAVKLVPWADGSIRPYETAPAAARDAELRVITAGAAHVEPVLAAYADAAGEIDRLLRRVEDDRPTLEVTTADGTLHRVWRMRDAEVLGKLRHQFAPKKLHVLDGHARYEAMLAYRDALDAKRPLSMYSSGNYGLMCLANFDDPTLRTVASHRVIRGTIARDAVLAKARTWFIVEPLVGAARDLVRQQQALADTVAHQPAFVATFPTDADAWKLTLKPDVSPTAEGVTIHRSLAKFDPVVVDALFVQRALAGMTPVVSGEADGAAALAQVHAGSAQVALIMRALTLDQLKLTSDLGQTLPAGSTAFVPHVASGLVMSVIDADEDLV